MRHDGKVRRFSTWRTEALEALTSGFVLNESWHQELLGITEMCKKDPILQIRYGLEASPPVQREEHLTDEAIKHLEGLEAEIKKAYTKFQAKGGLDAQFNKHEISMRLKRIKKNLIECYGHGLDDERFDEFVQEVKAEALLKS
jgi:hypothetical protein